MTPNEVFSLIALKPAALVTVALLALCVLGTVALTLVIKRREAARRGGQPQSALQSYRVEPPATADLPPDVQKRLRYLTANLDQMLEAADAPATTTGTAPRSAATPDAPARYAPSGRSDDATRHFGGTEDSRAGSVFDSTTRFHDAAADDATRFFGQDEAALDLKDFFGEDIAPLPVPAGEQAAPVQDDATRYFASDDEPRDDATHFFAGEDEPRDDATTFFAAEDAQQDDATRFFAAEEPEGNDDARDDATRFFAADDEPRERDDATRFFSEEEPEVDGAAELRLVGNADLAPAGSAAVEPMDTAVTVEHAAAPAADFNPADITLGLTGATGPLQALPPARSVFQTGALDNVRACLSMVTTPEVIALSVLDASGRVLAGETDDELTGELRSLMAEANQGTAADVDQPVRLADNSNGAILLLPTGANAVLGALIFDADDPGATRASLRGLAREIGDAMRRAS